MFTDFYLPPSLKDSQRFKLANHFLEDSTYKQAFDHYVHLIESSQCLASDIIISIYEKIKQDGYRRQVNLYYLSAKLYFHLGLDQLCFDDLTLLFEQNSAASHAYPLLFKLYERAKFKENITQLFESLYQSHSDDAFLLDSLPKLYFDAKNQDKLIAFYENLSQKKPNELHLLDKLSSLYLHNKRFESAANTYRSIFSKNPDYIHRILPQVESFILEHPQSNDIRLILIELHTKHCSPDKALQELKTLLIQDPNFSTQAMTYCKTLLQTYPDHIDSLLLTAHLHFDANNYTDAVSLLYKLYELAPSKCDPIKNLLIKIIEKQPSQALAKLLLCTLATDSRDHEKSLQLLIALIESNYPDHNDLLQRIQTLESAQIDNREAIPYLYAKYFLMKQEDTCLNYCDQLLESKYFLESCFIRSDYYLLQNRVAAAREALTDALTQSDPHTASLHHCIKRLNYKALSNEINKITKYQKKHQHARLYFKLALLHLRRGTLLDAISTFQLILEDDFLYKKSEALLGRSFFEQGRLDLAYQIFEQLLNKNKKLEPTLKKNILFLIASTHFLQGRIQKGIQSLEQIYAYDVNFPFIQDILTHYKTFIFNDDESPYLTAFYFNNKLIPCSFYPKNKDKNESNCPKLLNAHKKAISYIFSQHYVLAKSQLKDICKNDVEYLPAHFNLCLLYIILNELSLAKEKLIYLKDKAADSPLIIIFNSLIEIQEKNYPKAIKSLTIVKDLIAFYPEFQLHQASLYILSNNIKNAQLDIKNNASLAIFFPFLQRSYCYLEAKSLDFNYWISPQNYSFDALLKRFTS
eukprot:COSAG01_NODE_519_length_16012_cov_4.344058_8_plen_807_part_00